MKPEKILEHYIKDLEQALAGLTAAERREILAEIRTHLQEKWEEQGDETGAGMLNAIEEFGEPEVIAREYTAGIRPKPPEPIPSWLVVVLTVFLWPVGIILAWLSSQWRTRNKIIATLIVPVLIVLMVVINLGTFSVYSHRITEFSYEVGQEHSSQIVTAEQSPARWLSAVGSVVTILIAIASVSSPLISGIYLAVTKTG